MSRIELGKRYPVELHPDLLNASAADKSEFSITLQYNFKPESFKRLRYAKLEVNYDHGNVILADPLYAEERVMKGTVASDVKESILAFDGNIFSIKPTNLLINSLKQVRGEKFVGEEAKRVNVTSLMKTLSKKKKKTADAASAAERLATVVAEKAVASSQAEDSDNKLGAISQSS